MSLKNKTVFITGGSRGIGHAIAVKCAEDGANVVIASKTDTPHPKLPGTIHSACEDVNIAGGTGLAVKMDIRDETAIDAAVQHTLEKFGGIDILINNASAIQLSNTLDTEPKRYDLMHQVNVRGTFLMSRACIPHLLKSDNPHILNLSPPMNMNPKWFKNNLAYTMSKYGMSQCVLGLSAEYAGKIGVNALWPATTVATSALQVIGDERLIAASRHPEIVADAAYVILNKPSKDCSGNFFIDEEVLKDSGVMDFESYAVQPGNPLMQDLFLGDKPMHDRT